MRCECQSLRSRPEREASSLIERLIDEVLMGGVPNARASCLSSERYAGRGVRLACARVPDEIGWFERSGT
jgi:hypothetical protein